MNMISANFLANQMDRGVQFATINGKTTDEYLQPFVRPKTKYTPKGYTITGYEVNNALLVGIIGEGLYIGTSHGIILWHESYEVAIAGCTIEDNLIEITQLQGAKAKKIKSKGGSEVYTNLSLSQALIQALVDIGANYGIEEARVIPGQLQDSLGHPGTSLEQFYKIYDQGAIKQGFHYDKKLQRYVKYI